ncbi:hypothetical protein [Streptacidiphilus neutrinimicus]|uniref:hypothetical protein n=1 Tax=Streptacidiphilus neutrinimicus TaxID=105420 RepID=UPI0005AA7DC7|nr:hypothetical protein [Streptacidiphilus neutrinimicus]
MTDMQVRHAELRLDRTLGELSDAFRGATAHPEESNCACHWGGAEELALLKTPDVQLDPALLRRTCQAADWSDHGAVLRRILPQLARAVVESPGESFPYWDEIGVFLSRGRWQDWPREQAAVVREFLLAFWARSLVTSDPAAQTHTHTHQALVLCVEASGELSPWLDIWERTEHATADRRLAEAVDAWDYDLLVDRLPWSTWHDEDDLVAVLTAWLTRHAPARLRAHNASDSLLQRLRLIGLTGDARWDDPHWPPYTY